MQNHMVEYAKTQIFFFILTLRTRMTVLKWFLVKHNSQRTLGVNKRIELSFIKALKVIR